MCYSLQRYSYYSLNWLINLGYWCFFTCIISLKLNDIISITNQHSHTGAWSADSSDANPWIQANFNGEKTVSSITTQGRHDDDHWVTSYTVTYADSSGNWHSVTDSSGNTLPFTANTDRNTAVTNSMPDGVVASNVRLWPVTWNGRVSMRFMVQGCDYVGK